MNFFLSFIKIKSLESVNFERETKMSLALERSKRQNAGSKMTRLIENEEDDDFYKTAYGGFAEVIFF